MAQQNPFLANPLDELLSQTAPVAQAAIPATPAAPQPEQDSGVQNAPRATAPATTSKAMEGRLPPPELRSDFDNAASEFNVPVNVLMALGNQESDYNPRAIGPQTQWGRAKGLMQYLDETARRRGINPLDARQSIRGAAEDIRQRLDKGYSMEDAVKEHFAGTDRAKWGQKTAAYGQNVLARAGQIGGLLGAPSPDATDNGTLQDKLNAQEPGRYKVLDQDAVNNQFSDSMGRDAYAETFRRVNPTAPQAVFDQAMKQYDDTAKKRVDATTSKAQTGFDVMASPNATFDTKLNASLQGARQGIIPQLPARLPNSAPDPAYDAAAADRETKLSAMSSQIGKSLHAGGYDLVGAGAKILDSLNPFTTSDQDAAVLFKNDPEGLKKFQDSSVSMILSRFSQAMAKNSDAVMAQRTDRAKRDYDPLEYMTADGSKSAFGAPEKVIGDAVRSLPTMVAMAVSVYLTRGAAARAEQGALSAGLSAQAARQAGIDAGAKAMSIAGASSEGAVGYAQQASQTFNDVSKMSPADMAKSPRYQQLIQSGYTPYTARAKIIADTAEQAGQIAGIVDAAVNKVGGEFLGRILTEGGRLIPRIMKGAANEGATEFVQSAGEQFGQNYATRMSANPDQSLSEGVGEAAVQGLAVGGLMGGTFAGIGGRGHTEVAQPPAQQQAAAAAPTPAPASPAEPTPAAVAAIPKPVGPLESAIEKKIAPRSERQIVGDDGKTYALSSGPDGVQMTEMPPAGPMQSAAKTVSDALPDTGPSVEVDAAVPMPEKVTEPAFAAPAQESVDADGVVQPAAAPAIDAADLSVMSMSDLRARLKYIAQQAKVDGWNRMMSAERRRVEKEIDARANQPEKPIEKPVETKVNQSGYGNIGDANSAVLKLAEQTGKPHGVVERQEKGKTVYDVQPLSDVSVLPSDSGDRARADDARKPVEALAAKNESAAVLGNDEVRAGEQQAALTPDAHAGKWFGSPEKAQAYIDKKKIGDTHAVKQTGKVRFEIKPNPTIKENLIVQSASDAAPVGTTFKTAKGSTYVVNEDGTTTRDKAGRPEHPGESGIQPKSDATIYVTKEQADLLGEVQAQGAASREVAPVGDGRYGVRYRNGKNAGKFEGRTVVTPQTSPAVGLYPVELAEGKTTHFGNKITEVSTAAPTTKGESNESTETGQEGTASQEADTNAEKGLSEPVKAAKPPKVEVGDMITATGDIGYMKADTPVRVTHVDKNGTFHVEDPVTGGRTSINRTDMLVAQRQGFTYEKVPELAPIAEASNDDGPTDTPPPKSNVTSIFSKNKVFTEDKVAAARKLLKSKMGQLNSGIDPEMMTAGMTLAGAYIESGVRSFTQYAKAMTDDFGDAIKPYLLSFYESVRHYPGIEKEGMTPADQAVSEHSELMKAPAESPRTLAQTMQDAIASGDMPKNNLALRKMIEEYDGAKPDDARMKQGQEILESAIAQHARTIVSGKGGVRAKFDSLLAMYESQPNLNVRTSSSVENMAYSTPAPLAYLVSNLAGVTKSSTVEEPTAGTGMLLIATKPENVLANEMDPFRAQLLRDQGYPVTQENAVTADLVPGNNQVDAVLANPPFGPIKGDDGSNTKVKVDGFQIGQIDQLIVARALENMRDDGKASFIIGANKLAGAISNNDLIFMNWLYSNYNVTSHFEIDGNLYVRQGAGWPVRVITVDGRAKSANVSPRPGTIPRATNWSEVYEQYQNGMDARRESVAAAETASVRDSYVEAEAQSVPEPAGGKAEQPGAERPAGRARRAGNEPGTNPRDVGGGEQQSAGPVGATDGSVGRDGATAGENRLDDAGKNQTGGAANPVGNSGAASLSLESPENQFQSTYVPRSSRKDDGVLIPVNMRQPTQDALSRLEDRVGDIDQYAAKELGYKSVEGLHDAFMGLQVDSVASSIYQIEQGKGVIIADQTGIGKGRQAAAVIRWAAKKGYTPVFITVKPSLFTDMYGDLRDIGSTDINPLIMNVDESIKGDSDEKLFSNKPAAHRGVISRIAETGALPKGRNALFATYSQMNVANAQRTAIESLAPNAVFILDESHNAGGDSSTGRFIQSVLGAAKGVTYLSATYAKRPDNMPVYFKTDIGDAVADTDTLLAAMESGGLPLQTVVSNNLVKAGQMFRRERSYDGVNIESRADVARRAEHEALSNETTLALREIVEADRQFHQNTVRELQDAAAGKGERVRDDAGNQAAEGVTHSEFSSVVHNFVRQMLLGLKAQTAADEAIASLARSEKPLIALENTMGSFLQEYADNNNLKPGDSLGNFDYRNVLSRALERTRYVTRQLPNGEKVKEFIELKDLDARTRQQYVSAQKTINGLKISIPVSPIDWMRSQIEKAGHSVAEITGRNLSVDYSDPANPKLSSIDAAEQRDKVQTTRRFNAGKLDAIILNVAGSTGISLHASSRFADQRQRHMIVAQPAQDINIFMQMLGRIHRTGQVNLPKYTILSVDLPAEKRPTALLSKKMKSLNANTSSNTESATSVKSADMLNKYGDQVIGQYLQDNPDLSNDLGISDPMTERGPMEDVARKGTGRLALMPVEVQAQFYDEVEGQYTALMDYLNKTNQNDLEPRTFDFDAQERKSQTIFEGENKDSPFGDDAVYGEYSVKAQGKAMSPDEIRASMVEHLNDQTPSAHAKALVDRLMPDYLKYLAKSDDGRQVAEQQIQRTASEFVRSHPIGSAFRIDINGDIYSAVVTNLRSIHKSTGNPFSLSKFHVTVAVNGALRSITVPATQFERIQTAVLPRDELTSQFAKPTESRELAKIVTGNLLAAYGELAGSRGTVISFTKQDGTIEQGILLPKTFSIKNDTKGDYRLKTGEDAYRFLTQSTMPDTQRLGIATRDNVVRVTPVKDGIVITVPKSKAKGGKYFLDDRLRAVTGDFVSSGSTMRVKVPESKAAQAMDVLMQKQALYAPPSMQEEARRITEGAKPPPDDPDGGGVRYSIGKDGDAEGEFGPARTDYENKPAEAISRLMTEKTGEAVGAVVRPDIGEISLVYGDDNFGLKHIADRRGADFFKRLPNLLKNGEVYTKPDQVGRIFIGDARDEAAVRLDWNGEAKTWLVSAYERYPAGGIPASGRGTAGAPKSQRSTVVMQRMEDAGKQGMTVPGLDKTLRSGPLGSVIGGLIDSGKVNLYSTARKLPPSLRGPTGIQAVTDKNGVLHIVSNTLTPERAQAVLLHEMFHSGTKSLIGSTQWGNLQGRLSAIYSQGEQSTGRAREFWDKAAARVEDGKKKGGISTRYTVEEFGAYAIEEYESAPASVRKWVDDLIGAVKAWLVQRFGVQAGQVTPAQLRALAVAALNSVSENQDPTTTQESPRYSIAAEEDVDAAPASLTPPDQGLLRRLQSKVQDNMNRVRQVQDRITDLTGVKDFGFADYYGAETNRPGRIAARLEDAEQKLLKPLMTGLAKSGFTQDQLSELLHAEHAEERNARVAQINPEMQDSGSGMTTEEANEIKAKYSGAEFSELHKLADQARSIARATLDLKFAYKLISKADYDTLAKAYENYIPLKGDGEFGPRIKRAMGHEGRDEHILQNIARDYQQAIVVGERNLARQSLLALILENPDPDLWTVGIPPKGRYVAGQVYNIVNNGETVGSFSSRSQVDAFLEAKGPDAVNYEVLDSNGDRVREFTKPLQNNEVMIYVDGDPVRVQIKDEALARQLRPLNQGQMNVVLEKMRGMNRYLSKIYTGYNPAFILRNATRDAMTGTINMIGNQGATTAAKAWIRYPQAAAALAQWSATGKAPAGKTGEMLNEYRLSGGKTGASWMSDLEQQGKTLSRLYDDAYGATGYLKKGNVPKATWIAGRKAIGALAHVVEVANQATENGLRLALYMQLRSEGVKAGDAAQAAKTVTVDFDRKGSATGVLGAMYLFINPAIQGTANAAKTLTRGEHRYQAWSALALLPMLGMFAGTSGMDDDKDRWLGRNWDTRTKNFIYHVGSHELRIPMSQEYAPFYAAGVAIGEAMRGESQMKSAARVVSSFLDAYVPLQGLFSADSDNHTADALLSVVPTIAQPVVRSAANRNNQGFQIVPENSMTQDRPDNLKMYRGTKNSVYDASAQAIAAAGHAVLGANAFENDISKVSPETLKMMWRTYTGGLGTFLTDSAGLAHMTAQDAGQVESGDIPIVKDFWRPNTVAPIRSRFFDLAKDAKSAASEFRQARKAGDDEAMDEILRNPTKSEMMSLSKLAASTSKSSAKMRDEAVDVNADKSMTPVEKKARLKELEKEEEIILREGISAFK